MAMFIDTNVLIDVIARREPFFKDSQSVLSLCFLGKVNGFVRRRLSNRSIGPNFCDLRLKTT
jgi:predicted nucleic acid-binding protein